MTCLAASKRGLCFFRRCANRYHAWRLLRELQTLALVMQRRIGDPFECPPGPLLRAHRQYEALTYLPALDLCAFPPDSPDWTNDRVLALTYALKCIAPPRRPYIQPM